MPTTDPGPAHIQAQLQKILASPGFRGSRRRSELLQWTVHRVLAGQTDPVKEYHLGLEVFGKLESWDPRLDSSVRVEFARMRQKLRDYYAQEGASDPVFIEFPFRSYAPSFAWRPRGSDSPAAPPAAGANRPDRRIAAIAAALLLTAAAIGALRRVQASPPLTTVAVLPFIDLTPGGQREYLSDGLAEELTNSLAAIRGLRVVARTSAFQFKNKNVDIREIGRQLGVGAVVEGSILSQGNRLHVTVELNRTTDGTHVWQAQYDREAKDVLGIQDEAALAVATAMGVRPSAPGARVRSRPRRTPGISAGLRRGEKVRRCLPAPRRGALPQGHPLGARFARAYLRLGSVYIARAGRTGPGQVSALENARQDLEKAVSLDPDFPRPPPRSRSSITT